MDPDAPPGSPFAPGYDPADIVRLEPFGETPERKQPRLGILHLLVWTACIAFFLGINRFFLVDVPGEFLRQTVIDSLDAFGTGTALGGLLLWAARRWRGLRFPRYPGEYLLVALGVSTAIGWTCSVTFRLASLVFAESWLALVIQFAVASLAHAASFLAAAICVKLRRWRLFFGSVAAMSLVLLLTPLAGSFAAFAMFGFCGVCNLAWGCLLVVVVLIGWREEKRYPWTHWLGIGTMLWYEGVALSSLVVNLLLR